MNACMHHDFDFDKWKEFSRNVWKFLECNAVHFPLEIVCENGLQVERWICILCIMFGEWEMMNNGHWTLAEPNVVYGWWVGCFASAFVCIKWFEIINHFYRKGPPYILSSVMDPSVGLQPNGLSTFDIFTETKGRKIK